MTILIGPPLLQTTPFLRLHRDYQMLQQLQKWQIHSNDVLSRLPYHEAELQQII